MKLTWKKEILIQRKILDMFIIHKQWILLFLFVCFLASFIGYMHKN